MPIKIAVIGCGYWGPNLVRNFYQINEAKVVWLVDLDESRLNHLRTLYPAVRTTRDYREALKDKEIDGVAIATPVSTHFKIARDILRQKKHILVEKPLTLSSKEAEELIWLARKNKKVLMVDHTFIYTGAVAKIKELIKKGQLGKLYYFDSERINLGLLQSDINVIWDLAVHDISIIDYLFDQKPISVLAVGSSHVLRGKRKEMAHLTIKHQAGFISHIHVSWLSPVKLRKILISGSKKMVLYDDVEPAEKIRIYDKGIDIEPSQVTPFTPLYRGGDIVIPKIDQTEALKKVCQHFLDCIKYKKKPLTDGQAGLRVVKILEATDKSLEGGGKEIKLMP